MAKHSTQFKLDVVQQCAVVRDIQALILQTEEVAATGRACQAFVQAN